MLNAVFNIWIGLFALLLQSDSKEPPAPLSVADAINNSAKYDGRAVSITGILFAGMEHGSFLEGSGCVERMSAMKRPFGCAIDLRWPICSAEGACSFSLVDLLRELRPLAREASSVRVTLTGKLAAAPIIWKSFYPPEVIPGIPNGEYVTMGFGHMNAFPVRLTVTDARVHRARFEDYPADTVWQGSPPRLNFPTPSERMFKTRLTEAAKEPANFAGHYRMAYWGCGSNCSAGALIDLQTGNVYQPPLATPGARGWERWMGCVSCFDNTDEEFRVDSRLMIVRCGLHYSERFHTNIPDTYYFLWDGSRFQKLLFVSGETGAK